MVELTIENLKCGGCVNTVTKTVQGIEGVKDVSVNLESATVRYEIDGKNRDLGTVQNEVIQKLASAGYPLLGEGNAWQKAVSYVSCAKGRMS